MRSGVCANRTVFQPVATCGNVPTMRDFNRLEVWRRAHSNAVAIYELTAGFPREERYGLVSQLRRAAVSIPSNIAEGSSRSSRRDYARFLEIAMGSSSECDYQLLLARDLGYIGNERHERLHREVNEIRRMLSGLRAAVLAEAET
jgi:four helix bundle protein